MPYEVRTPFSRSAAQKQGGGLWRKRVLPVGSVEYKGRKLHFDKSYLEGLAEAFRSRAYDQVPFQIADAANTHTNDPERYRGEITGMEARDDGLWITMKPTPAGNTLLETNPRLGVSARIVEDYARSDGQYYPRAIQHVLGTLDPRIPDLGAWERATELSGTIRPEIVIDLSAATFAGEAQEGGTMPDLTTEQQNRLAELLNIDPAKLAALADSVPADADASPGAGSGGTDDVLSDDELAELIDSMTDEEFAALQAEYELDTGDLAPQGEPAGAGAGLSNNGYGYSEIELTNYQLAETQRQLGVLQQRADEEAFANEKRRLAGQHNVPPFITELARPLLEGTGHVVELANGQAVDAGLIVRRVLTEFGRVTQGLGLEAPVELGSGMDEPDASQNAETARADLVARYRSQVGI